MYFDFTSFFISDNRIYVFTTDEKRNASPELVALYEAEMKQMKQPEAMETDDTGNFIIWNYYFLCEIEKNLIQWKFHGVMVWQNKSFSSFSSQFLADFD